MYDKHYYLLMLKPLSQKEIFRNSKNPVENFLFKAESEQHFTFNVIKHNEKLQILITSVPKRDKHFNGIRNFTTVTRRFQI